MQKNCSIDSTKRISQSERFWYLLFVSNEASGASQMEDDLKTAQKMHFGLQTATDDCFGTDEMVSGLPVYYAFCKGQLSLGKWNNSEFCDSLSRKHRLKSNIANCSAFLNIFQLHKDAFVQVRAN